MADVVDRPMRRMAEPEMAISPRGGDGRLAGPGANDRRRRCPAGAASNGPFSPNPAGASSTKNCSPSSSAVIKPTRRIFRRLNCSAVTAATSHIDSFQETIAVSAEAESELGILGPLDAMMHPYREQFEIHCPAARATACRGRTSCGEMEELQQHRARPLERGLCLGLGLQRRRRAHRLRQPGLRPAVAVPTSCTPTSGPAPPSSSPRSWP